MPRIFNTLLTIERHTGGSRNPTTKKYEDNPSQTLTGYFSVQPYKEGSQQMILPDGIRSEDAYTLYGETPIQGVDQFDFIKADKTTIKGRVYIAFKIMDWTFHGSRADHYKSVWIREDKISQRTQ